MEVRKFKWPQSLKASRQDNLLKLSTLKAGMAAATVVTPIQVTSPVVQLFGLNTLRASDFVSDYLVPLLQPGKEDVLLSNLKELGDNASLPLRLNFLRDLFQISTLPQEELLFFFWRCLGELHCKPEVLTIVCEELRDFLKLHLDFRHRISNHSDNQITGFPLLVIARSLLPAEEAECVKRMDILLINGADVNARYRDEKTPVHLAAECEAWDVVKLLLDHDANIDFKFSGVTARQIIGKSKINLVRNVLVRQIPELSKLDIVYEALYAGNEEKTLELIDKHNVDVNKHNGRETLLQLAIKQKLPKVVAKLNENAAADVNLIAGLSIYPIVLALENPDYECLAEIRHNRNLNLRFSHESGTFLNAMALRCTRCRNAPNHRHEFINLIDEVIKQRIHISALNKAGLSALEQLGFGAHEDSTLFHILLQRGGFLTIDENLVLNTRPTVFYSFFESQTSFSEEYTRGKATIPWHNRSEYMNVNFKFLEPLESSMGEDARAAEMLPFFEMCKSREHQSVLLHEVVTLFLVYKWRKIAFIYMANFILYSLFTALFSVHIYQLTVSNYKTSTGEAYSAENVYILSFSILFWILLLCRELFQIFISWKQYVRNWENVLEILLLAVSFLTFLPLLNNVNVILATAIALTYIELTLLIGRHPYTGTYITMFLRVSMKSLELILIFSSFIFAFAYGFFVFFYKFSESNGKFNNLWQSVLSTIGMTGGEFNLDTLSFNSLFSEIAFIAFLIFVPVVLMNLLNALAVSDTQRVIDEASLLCCVANIKHYTKIESMWLGYNMQQSDSNLAGDRAYGFLQKRTGTSLLYKIRALFHDINVLPFPQNPHINPEPTHFLKIYINHQGFHPQPYWRYIQPTNYQINNYKIIYRPRNPYHFIVWLYFRVLLKGNEDEAIRISCQKRKYYSPSNTDVSECLDDLRRNLRVDIALQCNDMQQTIEQKMDFLAKANTSGLVALDDKVRSQSIAQSLILDTLKSSLVTQERVLAEIKQKQMILSSESSQLLTAMQDVATNLKIVKQAVEESRKRDSV
ncbi:hypothetical protein B566_EDAN009854 [Ephemera danica]|nr:hypothetical protein B566_EDAN009854 [Ephemera danica]